MPNSNITFINNDTCVNWNYYYTECKGQGNNPFQGTISFDNIGLAWVAIFLVSALVTRPTFVQNNLRVHVYTYSNVYMWHGIFLPFISKILLTATKNRWKRGSRTLVCDSAKRKITLSTILRTNWFSFDKMLS